MYCLDANVWVYFFDEGYDEHAAVAPAVTSVLDGEQLFTTTVLQMEVIHYLSDQLADSEAIVDRFLGLDGTAVAELTDRDVDRAAEILHEHANTDLGGRDASVLTAIDRSDVTDLWTHDEALASVARQFDGIDVTDPVAEASDGSE